MFQKIKNFFLYFLILVYVSGSIGFVYNPSFFGLFTPYTLLFTCFVYLIFQTENVKSFVVSFFIIALLGFIIEVIGVKTSLVFGAYHYGEGLGMKFLAVPIIISVNWAILITSGVIIVSKFFTQKYTVLVLSALLVTSIDVIIEQVAPKLNFWFFKEGIAGIPNYIAWFCISFLLPIFFYPKIIKGNYTIALVVILLQIIFFTTLYLFL